MIQEETMTRLEIGRFVGNVLMDIVACRLNGMFVSEAIAAVGADLLDATDDLEADDSGETPDPVTPNKCKDCYHCPPRPETGECGYCYRYGEEGGSTSSAWIAWRDTGESQYAPSVAQCFATRDHTSPPPVVSFVWVGRREPEVGDYLPIPGGDGGFFQTQAGDILQADEQDIYTRVERQAAPE